MCTKIRTQCAILDEHNTHVEAYEKLDSELFSPTLAFQIVAQIEAQLIKAGQNPDRGPIAKLSRSPNA